MKIAENLAGVHTHTHTGSLNNNKKINKLKKDRNINPVSILDTGWCCCLFMVFKYKIMKRRELETMKKIVNEKGITLVALVITTIFCYDEFIKASNNKGFLLQTI